MKPVVVAASLAYSLTVGAVLVGRVDIQRVLVTVKQGQKIRDELKKEFDKKDKVIQQERAAIDKLQEGFGKLQENFQKQSLVMSEQKKAERGRELQEKGIDIQRKMVQLDQKANQFQEEIQQMENTKKAPVLQRIRETVEEVSKKNNLDFTFESSTASIVYAKDLKDITDETIKAYDAKHK